MSNSLFILLFGVVTKPFECRQTCQSSAARVWHTKLLNTSYVSKPWSHKQHSTCKSRDSLTHHIPKDRVSKEVIFVSPWLSSRFSVGSSPGLYSLSMEVLAFILSYKARTIRYTGGCVRDCSFYWSNRFTQSSFEKGKSINCKYICAVVDVSL